jgi:hypothetical protein
MVAVTSAGHKVEERICDALTSLGYTLLRNTELDREEAIDFIITSGPKGDFRQPIEVQVTTQNLSLNKFKKFVASRHHDRIALSIYLSVGGKWFINQSVEGIERAIRLYDGKRRRPKQVVVVDVDFDGKSLVYDSSAHYLAMMKQLRSQATMDHGVVVGVEPKRIMVKCTRSPYVSIFSHEIVDLTLRQALAEHNQRGASLMKRNVLVYLHPRSTYGIHARLLD